MSQEKRQCLKSETVLKFDMFGTPMLLNFSDGSPHYRSALGSCFTLIIFVLTSVFLLTQIRVMTNHMDTVFTSSIEYGYFE